MTLLTELQYFAPVVLYKRSIKERYIELEQYERWQKMSFRNRCTIAGANGLIDLSIPITGGRDTRNLIRDIRIDNMLKWQKIHWRGITSAYNRSPWFEFYAEELSRFYEARYTYLWDWNLDLMHWVLQQLKADVKINFTDSYKANIEESDILDYRNKILPKNIHDYATVCPVYNQVFQDRLGFQPNLSIIDLLFCEGNNAADLLRF